MTAADDGVPRVSLIPGPGVVIRRPGFLCVLGEACAELAGDVQALGDAAHADAAAYTADLARIVSDSEFDVVDIAFAATDDARIAIYLAGDVAAEIDGRRVSPGVDEPFEQTVQWPLMGLGLLVGDAVADPAGEERFALVDGAVPACGARLHAPEVSGGTAFYNAEIERVKRELAEYRKSKGPQAPEPASEPVAESLRKPAAEAVPESAPEAARAPEAAPFVSSSLFGDDGVPARPPLEEARPALDAARPPSDPATVVPAPHRSPATTPPPPPPPWRGSPLAKVPTTPPPRPRVPSRPPVPSPMDETMVSAPIPAQRPQQPHRPRVMGVRCVNGHLNHPAAWICGACGIRMEQMTTVPVLGERPALGWLLLDTGEVFSLDADYLIGRVPSNRPGGPAPGEPKAIVLADTSETISRRHVEIRLVEWDVLVVDLGSINGTFVLDPGPGAQELQLAARRPHRLTPGARIRVGNRVLTFESPHARI